MIDNNLNVSEWNQTGEVQHRGLKLKHMLGDRKRFIANISDTEERYEEHNGYPLLIRYIILSNIRLASRPNTVKVDKMWFKMGKWTDEIDNLTGQITFDATVVKCYPGHLEHPYHPSSPIWNAMGRKSDYRLSRPRMIEVNTKLPDLTPAEVESITI